MHRTLPTILLLAATHLHLSQAVPTDTAGLPTVRLDNATAYGFGTGVVNYFLGIPYAQPPTGDRRFRLPQPLDSYTTDLTAWAFGTICPQQTSSTTTPTVAKAAFQAAPTIQNNIDASHFQIDASSDPEDCLNLDVVAPANATTDSKLPVVVWIYGGAFEGGSTSTYDGGLIVSRSIQMGEPVVYVAMNYRLSGLGFLASKEVKAAGVGNLGLQDQRQAFRWVQKYITSFGGDPSKVTIWGESAGAVSVALQMVANNGNSEGLFRGGVMQSGSPLAFGDITYGQGYYDAMVAQTGCSSAADTLGCLRGVPYATLMAAIDASPGVAAYQSLSLAWQPRVDGVLITDVPTTLVREGKVANIPFITGDCDDEGTLFSLSNLNITTDDQFKTYISQYYFTQASSSDLDQVLYYYPNDIRAGSPFDTGYLGALTWQYKRIAAFLGDYAFQAPRRYLLQQRASQQNAWAFLSKRGKTTAAYGSYHGSDLLNSWGAELRDYIVNFANNLDPNGSTVPSWPKWSIWAPSMATFLDGAVPMILTPDTYRASAIEYLTELAFKAPH